MDDISGYRYGDAALGPSHEYLLPAVCSILEERARAGAVLRIFELGCGNGAVANALQARGFEVVGVDPSAEGIARAHVSYPTLRLEQRSAYDDLAAEFGTFPILLSLEVVEHLYFPRKFAATAFSLLEPGGVAIVSTPYHGYWKNLALALTGKMDGHFTALWDHGHIKFWSVATLRILLREAGFHPITYVRVGRIPALAKSMIAVARKPAAT